MSDIWPLFDLRVSTPRLELRYVDDELGHALARLAAHGIHDPASTAISALSLHAAPPLRLRSTLE